MKRRDWKIKKLKKDIYGKFFKKKRIFFLRKLYIRKNLVLFKKNLIPNYFFYNKLLKNFNKQKLFHFKKSFLLNSLNFSITTPNHFFKKKIFGFNNDFFQFINNNNLNYLFLKNRNNLNLIGINVLLFNNKNEYNFDLMANDDVKSIVIEKTNNLNTNINEIMKSFNFYFNYNLTVVNNLEIYKIITILYINKLK